MANILPDGEEIHQRLSTDKLSKKWSQQMTIHVACLRVESQEPKAEIGDHCTMERTNQHWPVQLCQLSR